MERSLVLSLSLVVQVLVALTESHRIVFPISVTLEEGDTCTMHSGVQGRCTDIRHCDYTSMDFRVKPPVRCGFNGIFPVVCCPSVSSNNPGLVTDIAPPNLGFQCGRNAKNTFTLSFSFFNDKKFYAETEDANPVKIFNVMAKLKNGTEVFQVAALGSEQAEKNAWPWMALVGKRGNKDFTWFCGGVLINDQWVLTALHCLLDNTAEVVRLGEHNYKNDNDGAAHEDFDVAETVLYPGYSHPQAYHDLALLRLAPRVTIKEFMSPVCLAWGLESDVDITNQNTTLTGYGDTQLGGIPTSYLQEVNVTVFPAAQCDRSYSSLPHYTRTWPRGIGQETLCAGDPAGGRDACQGDSGGPLVSQDSRGLFVLAGIVSRGYGCGHKDYPGLYANLRHPPYLDWIKKVAFATP